MAFRRTLFKLGGGRTDVHPALVKWWGKHTPTEGQVTQHLSPFEQNIMAPMYKTAHKQAFQKVKDFVLEAGPGLGFFFMVYLWAEKEHEEIAMHHRC